MATSLALATGCDSPAPDGESTATTAETPTGDLEVALVIESEGVFGDPLEVTVGVTNHGERSRSAPIELAVVAADGTETTFATTTLFVPFGESATESTSVTTSRWFPEPGDFEIVATVDGGEGAGEVSSRQVVTVAPTDRVLPRFEDVTTEAGVVTDVPEPECGQFANGAAWADVDGDGWNDLLVTRIGEPVRLFANSGDGTFIDETARRGVASRDVNGAAFADYDNDGDADLALVGDGPDRLLANDGRGHFTDVSESANLSTDLDARGMSAAWGDFDADGWLDLYVTNYMACTGPWNTTGEVIENVEYHADVLYRNEGDGTFRDVTDELPAADENGAGFTAAWLDLDDDGLLDLFVGNDFVGLSPDHNRVWRGVGSGAERRFEDVSFPSGAGLYMNTMGVGVADIDRDGDLDLALSNIGGNKLLRGNGDGTFVETRASGIERPLAGADHTTVTWATAFYDLDLDGWEDLVMTAGNLPQGPDVPIGEQPNMVFLNDGTGESFLDISSVTGFDGRGDSKGAAFADFDRDGAIDVVVVDQAGQTHLYRNVTPRAGRHWISIDPVGTVSNRDACGARIAVVAGGATQRRTVLCGSGGTASAHQREPHVGLGGATEIDRVEIWWPSGIHQVVEGPPVDELLTVVEPDS